MLNYLWALMIIVGVIYAVLTGNMETVTSAAINSAKEAVTLCITMCGVMSLWTGLMEVAQESGLITKMTKGISPFVTFLFPSLSKTEKAREYISINMISNILGLGWAATPAGLKAMDELKKLQNKTKTETLTVATNEMCTFLVINISSLQLIPVNIIAFRSQYGSAMPTSIIGPGLLATFVSTMVAVIYCKVMQRLDTN